MFSAEDGIVRKKVYAPITQQDLSFSFPTLILMIASSRPSADLLEGILLTQIRSKKRSVLEAGSLSGGYSPAKNNALSTNFLNVQFPFKALLSRLVTLADYLSGYHRKLSSNS